MVVLKKIKSSTLMETLVATVLIVIVFMLASAILNTLFSNTIKNNTQAIKNHLNELQYLEKNNQLKLPYETSFENWDIQIVTFKAQNKLFVEFEAINRKTNKTITFIENTD